MKYSLDTNVIISHFKSDRFSDDTDRFFAWIKNSGHKMYIADIVYAELYTGVYLSQEAAVEEKRLHVEQHSNALITWNPSDYNINIEVMTPSEVIETEQWDES